MLTLKGRKMDDDMSIKKNRGRPYGHRLSEKTKDKIRQKRLGSQHTQETKDKISRSLTEYFRKRNSLFSSIKHEYSYVSAEAENWVCEHKEDIDKINNVMTERRLAHIKQLEICMGSDIEYIFGHSITPEFLMILKEEMQEAGQSEPELDSLV
jgi:hypothetical protein